MLPCKPFQKVLRLTIEPADSIIAEIFIAAEGYCATAFLILLAASAGAGIVSTDGDHGIKILFCRQTRHYHNSIPPSRPAPVFRGEALCHPVYRKSELGFIGFAGLP